MRTNKFVFFLAMLSCSQALTASDFDILINHLGYVMQDARTSSKRP